MDNNNTVRTFSEYTLGVCGEPIYNVLPCDTLCMCSPQILSGKLIVCTDKVYDKELDKWQDEINRGYIGSDNFWSSGIDIVRSIFIGDQVYRPNRIGSLRLPTYSSLNGLVRSIRTYGQIKHPDENGEILLQDSVIIGLFHNHEFYKSQNEDELLVGDEEFNATTILEPQRNTIYIDAVSGRAYFFHDGQYVEINSDGLKLLGSCEDLHLLQYDVVSGRLKDSGKTLSEIFNTLSTLQQQIEELQGGQQHTFTVTINVTNGSSQGSYLVEYNESVTIDITPDQGYRLPSSIPGAVRVSDTQIRVDNVTSAINLNIVCEKIIEPSVPNQLTMYSFDSAQTGNFTSSVITTNLTKNVGAHITNRKKYHYIPTNVEITVVLPQLGSSGVTEVQVGSYDSTNNVYKIERENLIDETIKYN